MLFFVGANGIRPINDIIIKNSNNIQWMRDDLLYDFMRGGEYAWANAIRPYGGMRGGFPTLKELFVFLSI